VAIERIGAALSRRRTGELTSVLAVGLDGLTRAAAQHGSALGDAAMKWAAGKISETLRAGEQLFRIGDELTVLCEQVRSREGSERFAERLTTVLDTELVIGAVSVASYANVGIAIADDEAIGIGAHELLEVAAAALREATELGAGRSYCAPPKDRRRPSST
jgi:diguanylate cyclase (GGDEF)-like protein